MNLLRLTALLIYTYGAFAYGTIVILAIRRYGFGAKPGSGLSAAQPCHRFDFSGVAITLASFVHFSLSLLITLLSRNPEAESWPLLTASLFIAFLFPPLIMHSSFDDLRDATRIPLHPGWKRSLWAVYVVSPSIAVLSALGFWGVIVVRGRVVGIAATVALSLLFTVAAIYSSLALSKRRAREETVEARSSRKWTLVLFAALVSLSVLVVVSISLNLPLTAVLAVAFRSTPLAFLFIGTYYGNRFEFFDLLIKRGVNLLITIVLFTAYFGLALPWLQVLPLDWARPWMYAVVLMPVAASLPWLYRAIGRALDNYWLGRQFTTVEAVKHFLASMQSATSEARLVEQAEEGLAEIFHTPVSIDLGVPRGDEPGFAVSLEASIGAGPQHAGVIRLGERTNRVPLFSEDAALLGSLADVFAYMLENMRLQGEKQEREQQARELSLHASRSELKALRAQINPHFLFNALNAIAGLIHRDPHKADRTVEQLAEVFRYTLRGSDTEWTVLDSEMEFVQAYLDVEQARFGQRLRFDVKVDDEVKPLRIPTMMVQTLVENAVKHGIAEVRAGGTIEVAARRSGDRLVIEVADNGPGFPEDGLEARRHGARKSSGYGLRNIRERLAGYFGEAASLRTRRDEARGLTVACIEIPLTPDQAGAAAASAASRAEPTSTPPSGPPPGAR